MCSVSKGSFITLTNFENEKDVSSKLQHLVSQVIQPPPTLLQLDMKQSGSVSSILDFPSLVSLWQNEPITFFYLLRASTLSQLNGELVLRTGESVVKVDLSKKEERTHPAIQQLATWHFMEELARGTRVVPEKKKRRVGLAKKLKMECKKVLTSLHSEEQALSKRMDNFDSNSHNNLAEMEKTSPRVRENKGGSANISEDLINRFKSASDNKPGTFPAPRVKPKYSRDVRREKYMDLQATSKNFKHSVSKPIDSVTPEEVHGILLHKSIQVLHEQFTLPRPLTLPETLFVGEQVRLLLKEASTTLFASDCFTVSQIEQMAIRHIEATFNPKDVEESSRRGSLLPLVSYHAEKGRREHMEDTLIFLPHFHACFGGDSPMDYLAVFDGHGGFQAASYAQQQLHVEIQRNLFAKKMPMKDALREAYLAVNVRFNSLAKRHNVTSGTTVASLLISASELAFANVGDSLGFVMEGDSILPATDSHKPSAPSENQRLQKEGADLVPLGNILRVGGLSVSRSIGDPLQEPFVTAEPFLFTHKLSDQTKFFVIASDGLWDVLSFDAVAEIVSTTPAEKRPSLAKTLVEKADQLDSSDNISVIVGFFHL